MQAIDLLILGVIHQAVKDVRSCRPSMTAEEWLIEDGAAWLDALGADYPADFEKWVRLGCPPALGGFLMRSGAVELVVKTISPRHK